MLYELYLEPVLTSIFKIPMETQHLTMRQERLDLLRARGLHTEKTEKIIQLLEHAEDITDESSE